MSESLLVLQRKTHPSLPVNLMESWEDPRVLTVLEQALQQLHWPRHFIGMLRAAIDASILIHYCSTVSCDWWYKCVLTPHLWNETVHTSESIKKHLQASLKDNVAMDIVHLQNQIQATI